MSDKVFCIGNAKSRDDMDLSTLKGHGRVYGCNAIYRDHLDKIDVLTAVDHGIIHEIYHAGVAQKIPCYFRNWTKVPVFHYEHVVKGMITDQQLDEMKDLDVINENERGDSQEFVIHGSTLSGMVDIIKRAKREAPNATPDIIKQKIHQNQVQVSWIKEPDDSHCVKDVFPEYKDHGWACGATAGYIACALEKPKEVYLIGHDLKSDTGKLNNLYGGTTNYCPVESEATPEVNWIDQWYTLMDWNPKIKFFKVNSGMNTVPTNTPITQWQPYVDKGQLTYITQTQLLDKLA